MSAWEAVLAALAALLPLVLKLVDVWLSGRPARRAKDLKDEAREIDNRVDAGDDSWVDERVRRERDQEP